MALNTVNVKAEQVYRKKVFSRLIKIAFLLLIIILSIVYLFLYIVYDGGRFTVSLDRNMSNRKNIFLSEDGKLNSKTRRLSADTIDYMDNISINWLPDNLDTEATGAHNGDNYIAYTFYVVNAGEESVHYWYEIDIDDTIKNVDEAIRIMIYRNGEPTVYAKKNRTTKENEPSTRSKQEADRSLHSEDIFSPPGVYFKTEIEILSPFINVTLAYLILREFVRLYLSSDSLFGLTIAPTKRLGVFILFVPVMILFCCLFCRCFCFFRFSFYFWFFV